jgi:hypothetical protein
MTAGTSRWERWARPRVLIAVVVVVLLTTVSLIVLYSILLGRMSKQVEEAQSRSANLSNAGPRGPGPAAGRHPSWPRRATPTDIGLHRAVASRQIVVSIVSFDRTAAGPRAAGRPGPARGVPLGPARREPRDATTPCAATRWR